MLVIFNTTITKFWTTLFTWN